MSSHLRRNKIKYSIAGDINQNILYEYEFNLQLQQWKVKYKISFKKYNKTTKSI